MIRHLSNAAKSASSPFSIFSRPVNAFQMNYYLLKCNKTNTYALIDSGFSSPTEFSTFLDILSQSEEGKSPKIKLLQTHAHIDHILGINASVNQFPDSKIYLHSLERPNWDKATESAQRFGITAEDAPSSLSSFEAKDKIIFLDDYAKNKKEIEIGELKLSCHFTPGHAPGHVIFYLEHELGKYIFGGDLIFSGGVGRTDLPFCSPSDMKESLKYVCENFSDDVVILPGHGPSTTLGDEKTTNPFF
eukprot:snap_masked-scaffold_14-processed-gene-0.9-mRNA-1 protein AED:1.00 eAED:1.00 QI:0/-1/0/0/-1/1/1/0/245